MKSESYKKDNEQSEAKFSSEKAQPLYDFLTALLEAIDKNYLKKKII